MRLINKLRNAVMKNCISKEVVPNSLAYWSDMLFAKSIFALIPLSLVALIPAIAASIANKIYTILIFDLIGFFTLFIIGYLPGISVLIRKIMLMVLLIILTIVLLNGLGNFGPGLVYLFSLTIFMLLYFPRLNKKLPFILTLIFCVLYGICIEYKVFHVHQSMHIPTLEWVAISANVLFLSALFSILIPFILSKLEFTILEQQRLQNSLITANSELKNSIEVVEKKNTELEEFAFVASHDLQEPLRMVSGFLHKLKKGYGDLLDEKAHQYIHFAVDGAVRMEQNILDLLEYSRAGKSLHKSQNVDLNKLIDDYLSLRRNIISEKSASILVRELPKVTGFRTPLSQTLHCIIDNAIKYSREGTNPQIIVQAEDQTFNWLISVADNGIGIESQFFDKIFVIFQRLHNRDKYGGSGLGLAIAKKLVEGWGGRIWLASEPDRGTTFYFTIPKTE